MKILSADQIRKLDEYTIENEPIHSVDLMERAARAFTQWFVTHTDSKRPVYVFAGIGNNGGDGLAISRMLIKNSYQVTPFLINPKDKLSPDAQHNLDRLNSMVEVNQICTEEDIPVIPKNATVIDAIFGSGLNRPIEGVFGPVVEAINSSGSKVVAVDIPSGMFADKPSEGVLVKADITLTFQVPKKAFFMPGKGSNVGELHVLDIGLDQEFLSQQESKYQLTQFEDILPLLHHRKTFAHKGDFGKVLLAGSSYGKAGSLNLSALACLRAGAGLVTLYIPSGNVMISQISIPEAMVLADPDEKSLSAAPDVSSFDTFGVGPGLGTTKHAHQFMIDFLAKVDSPIVIDADGLNLLSMHRELIELLPKHSILTPHPGELRRLVGDFKNGFEAIDKAEEFAREHQVIIVLKGAYTSIFTPGGEVLFNGTGNPGMATAGAGDVLTGVITGLLGQKYPPLSAALLGVYLHGMAGDLATKKLGQEAMIASDIIQSLGAAYRYMHEKK